MGNDKPHTFQLIVQPMQHDPRKYRVQVEAWELSEKIFVFKVDGGNRSITMQKNLGKRKDDWSILGGTVEMTNNNTLTALFILELRKELEEWIKKFKS